MVGTRRKWEIYAYDVIFDSSATNRASGINGIKRVFESLRFCDKIPPFNACNKLIQGNIIQFVASHLKFSTPSLFLFLTAFSFKSYAFRVIFESF